MNVTTIETDLQMLLDVADRIQQDGVTIATVIARLLRPTTASGAAPAPTSPALPSNQAPSFEALDDYDAAQLVAFRTEHRRDGHDPTGCAYCAILERRLGALA